MTNETASRSFRRQRWDTTLINPTDPTSVNDLPLIEIYTVDQVAVRLGISVGLTYELVKEGAIPAKRLGRRWIIPRVRFHAWLNDQSETA
ncbi:helix-turn-helix domain-containing protein [Pseudonocardia broussonetiae]|uniref:Helix-turn-helix domain-containing protein n=1 Tax=Pseudonocardia broussonetiae TaxID=2736640 RepID=A0A6M6JI92_9PSEU|nr:helix-turn-helix domain-containing protein [Pseudonocardia broussonetiae]QJY47784.1 helix-turn-helix domain-containing protein [Pseudonocardia broussonetiae]